MPPMKKWIFPLIVVLGVGIFALSGRGDATDAAYTFEGEPEIVAATFSSAWCSSCKILEPRLAKVIPDFRGSPVKFVDLDFTFGQRGDIEELAEREGLASIYPQFKGATGFTVLFDPQEDEIVDILTINHSQKAMRAAIAQALAIAVTEKASPKSDANISTD